MQRNLLGKTAYAVLFLVAVPALLIWWAHRTATVVSLPPLPYPWAGGILIGLGAVLTGTGMHALMAYGRGLPMNPYPPADYVTRSVYRLTPHPIYVGFVIAWVGASILASSGSGLWLVSPMVALASTALVLGHERQDLARRFGTAVERRTLVSLPPNRPSRPTGWDRASIVLLVFLPWTVVFEAVYRLGVPPDAVAAHLPFEHGWPVWEWTEAIYGSVYLFVVSAIFLARTQAALRRFAVMGLIATGVVTLVYLTVPLIAPPRPFEARTILGRALEVERAMSHTVAAFPAVHVIWTFIAADTWASRSRRWGVIGWVWALAIAASCLTTGMHAVVDIAAAVLFFFALSRYRSIWEFLRRFAERTANSWREWRWGRVRFINHGLYAAAAGAVGFGIAASFAGRSVFWHLAMVHVAGLAGAALWAQKLEGSSKLSRPFGYYGSVIGAVVGTLLVGLLGGNTMLVLGAIALEAPWMQAIGRLRCLVQGCCHGKESSDTVGIRYLQPRSRVCHLAGLRGIPLHPTPLYSILANIVVGILLLRLWSLGAPLSLVAGAYLLLAGATRFVEEAYRGEPQTPVVAGLRIYQWLAVLSFVAGLFVTTIPAGAAPGFPPVALSHVLVGAVGYGLLAGIAMGLDFPDSDRRFARLATA